MIIPAKMSLGQWTPTNILPKPTKRERKRRAAPHFLLIIQTEKERAKRNTKTKFRSNRKKSKNRNHRNTKTRKTNIPAR